MRLQPQMKRGPLRKGDACNGGVDGGEKVRPSCDEGEGASVLESALVRVERIGSAAKRPTASRAPSTSGWRATERITSWAERREGVAARVARHPWWVPDSDTMFVRARRSGTCCEAARDTVNWKRGIPVSLPVRHAHVVGIGLAKERRRSS
jgi:hypothetical protein